jgi:hypothetical protein
VEDLDVGYLARIFTQTALPYRDPGPLPAWVGVMVMSLLSSNPA